MKPLIKNGKQFAGEAEPLIRKSRRGMGHVIGVIVKIFAYFIVGAILFAIVVALFGVGVVFTGFLPAYDYVLGWLSKILSWGTFIFFIWVPVIAIVTWIIRRIAKKRGNSGLIRLTFLALWIGG